VLLPRSLKTTDKLFFFWSQEFQRQLRPNGANNRTVPTALERKGDFSQSVDNNGNSFTNKDPSTGSPFPGNVIPASSQYAPGIKLLKNRLIGKWTGGVRRRRPNGSKATHRRRSPRHTLGDMVQVWAPHLRAASRGQHHYRY
jgi:hypothetical protein